MVKSLTRQLFLVGSHFFILILRYQWYTVIQPGSVNIKTILYRDLRSTVHTFDRVGSGILFQLYTIIFSEGEVKWLLSM